MSACQLLDIQTEWANRGWASADLNRFRMEMSAGDLGGGGDAGGGAPAPATGDGGGTGQGAPPTAAEYSQMASGFLSRLPAEQRALLEPHVKQWDAGVTRQFQELHSQLNPYKELGEMDEVKSAMDFIAQLEDNPWAVYGRLQQALQTGEFGQQPAVPPVAPTPPPPQQEQGLSGEIPQAVQDRMQQLEQGILLIAQRMLGQQESSRQQQEDQQLVSALEAAHEEFGDFDEDAVLAKYMKDPSKSIAEHAGGFVDSLNTMLSQRQGGQPQNSLPIILGGGAGGALPGGNTDVRKLDRTQTQALIAEVLSKSKS